MFDVKYKPYLLRKRIYNENRGDNMWVCLGHVSGLAYYFIQCVCNIKIKTFFNGIEKVVFIHPIYDITCPDNPKCLQL